MLGGANVADSSDSTAFAFRSAFPDEGGPLGQYFPEHHIVARRTLTISTYRLTITRSVGKNGSVERKAVMIMTTLRMVGKTKLDVAIQNKARRRSAYVPVRSFSLICCPYTSFSGTYCADHCLSKG